MPLIKTISNTIFCWKNEESPSELLQQLNNQAIHQNKVRAFKSEDRIKQYLTNRILVHFLVSLVSNARPTRNSPVNATPNKRNTYRFR
mgnify:CR=1 FL=1